MFMNVAGSTAGKIAAIVEVMQNWASRHEVSVAKYKV
jgi:hypothetical protein